MFAGSSTIVPFADDFADFSVTNRGLHLSGNVPLRAARVAREGTHAESLYDVETLYLLFLGIEVEKSTPVVETYERSGGIYLRKLGPKLFYRDGLLLLADFGVEAVGQIG